MHSSSGYLKKIKSTSKNMKYYHSVSHSTMQIPKIKIQPICKLKKVIYRQVLKQKLKESFQNPKIPSENLPNKIIFNRKLQNFKRNS